MASIEIKGVDELIRKLGRVEGVKVLRAPMTRSVERLKWRMADYDNVPKMRPGEWASKTNRRQKAAYWVKVKELGRHPGRTGTSGRGWTTRIRASSGGLEGTVGNRVNHIPFLQSQRFQARMHRNRWPTDQQVAYNERNAIVDDFEREIRKALSKP